MKKKVSRVRSIRLSRELNDLLDQDAEEQRLTFNALISRILTKYAQWDRFQDKFGFVMPTSETFKNILSHCDSEALEAMGTELGARMTSQTALFWQKEMNFQGFLQVFALFSRYSGLYKMEARKDGSATVLTFHHNLGPKWSILLKSFVDSSLNSVLSKAEIRVDYVGNSVFARADRSTLTTGNSSRVTIDNG